MDYFPFLNYSSPFCFLLIEFHCTFSISYKILTYYGILIMIVYAVGISSFFCARFTSIHTHSSLLAFIFCYFVLLHSCCSHAGVFGKTHVRKFPISCSHTEWYFAFFRQCNYSAYCIFGEKNSKYLCSINHTYTWKLN